MIRVVTTSKRPANSTACCNLNVRLDFLGVLLATELVEIMQLTFTDGPKYSEFLTFTKQCLSLVHTGEISTSTITNARHTHAHNRFGS